MLTATDIALIKTLCKKGGASQGGTSQIDSLIDRTITEISSDSVTSIGSYAFYYCTALTTVNLPAATRIESYAFNSCSALMTVNLPAATRIGSSAFQSCTALTTVDLPAVTSIGNSAFNSCSALTTVDLPAVTTIVSYAFSGCSNLTAIILRSETIATMGNTNIFNVTPIKSGTGYIYVPAALVDSYKTATNWSVYANQIRAIEDYPGITGGAA